MYAAHFGLQENPFPPLSDPTTIFPSTEIAEATTHFLFARETHEVFFLLTGEVGTGKTTAIRLIRRELDPEVPVAVVSHATLGPDDLFEWLRICFELPKVSHESKLLLVQRLHDRFTALCKEGRKPVLILDEAHLLQDSVLEEVRLLSNLRYQGRPVLQICLVGQPELLARLRDARLRQLRQRITVRYTLAPLSREETRDYLWQRLREAGSRAADKTFHPRAADAVHTLTGGVPREVDVVARQAMLNAYLAGSEMVTREHVIATKKDYGFEGIRLPWTRSENWDNDQPEPMAEPERKTAPIAESESPMARLGSRSYLPALQRETSALYHQAAMKLNRFGKAAAHGKRIRVAGLAPIVVLLTLLWWVGEPGDAPPPGEAPSSAVDAPPIGTNRGATEPGLAGFAENEPADPVARPVAVPEPETEPQPLPQGASSPRPGRSRASLPFEKRYPGALKIETNTPAIAWLGEKRLGAAPGTFSSLPPGRYVLKLEMQQGRVLEKNVIVTAGSTTYIRTDSLRPRSR